MVHVLFWVAAGVFLLGCIVTVAGGLLALLITKVPISAEVDDFYDFSTALAALLIAWKLLG